MTVLRSPLTIAATIGLSTAVTAGGYLSLMVVGHHTVAGFVLGAGLLATVWQIWVAVYKADRTIAVALADLDVPRCASLDCERLPASGSVFCRDHVEHGPVLWPSGVSWLEPWDLAADDGWPDFAPLAADVKAGLDHVATSIADVDSQARYELGMGLDAAWRSAWNAGQTAAWRFRVAAAEAGAR